MAMNSDEIICMLIAKLHEQIFPDYYELIKKGAAFSHISILRSYKSKMALKYILCTSIPM